jgi:RNA polymerase sigma-70 factor (ECF subfamily)
MEKEAIQIIWKDLCQELRAFILQKVKDPNLADDILQETFIKIHLNIHKVRDPSKLTAWTYQITRNTITDYFRSKKDFLQIENFELAAEENPSYQKLSNCINNKINQLSQKYKEVMILNTFKNLKQTEIADYLGMSYSGAKTRVQRAKIQLKNLVADCDNVETDSKGNIIGHDLDA